MTRVARITCVLLFALGSALIVQKHEPREGNKWKREGNLDGARSVACSALLADVRVPILGGSSVVAPLATTGLFIPSEGTFKSIDSLFEARHTSGTPLQETSTFVFLRHVPITPLLPLFKCRRSPSLECTAYSLLNEKLPTTRSDFLHVIKIIEA